MTKYEQNRFTAIVVGISILITLIFISIFLLNFYSHGISEELSDWADFMTYFSGGLQTIFIAINLIVLLRITSIANNINEKQHSENLKVQKLTVLTNLRYDAIKEIHSRLDFVKSAFEKEKIYKVSLVLMEQSIKSFKKNSEHLFPDLEKSTQKILVIVYAVLDTGTEEEKKLIRLLYTVPPDLATLFFDLKNEIDNFIASLHAVTLNSLK